LIRRPDPGVEAAAAWWNSRPGVLATRPRSRSLMRVRGRLLASFHSAMTSLGALERFEIAGIVASWWERVKYDLRTIASSGFAGVSDDAIERLSRLADDEDNGGLSSKKDNGGASDNARGGAAQHRAMVLALLGSEFERQVRRVLRRHHARIAALLEEWWDEYSTSLHQLIGERDRASAAFEAVLVDLGYDGLSTEPDRDRGQPGDGRRSGRRAAHRPAGGRGRGR
ncbi:MAG: hypothetical protein AAGC55_27715, partial [Myxococcota bacterium]